MPSLVDSFTYSPVPCSLIGIGFCGAKVVMNRLPGWEPESWGYHGDDGNAFCSHGPGKSYGPQFAANDVIGCGVNFHTNTAFFTKNGVHLGTVISCQQSGAVLIWLLLLGTAFRELKQVKLYPSVGMKRLGEHVRVNFGQEEFMFDIVSYMRVCRSNNYLLSAEFHADLFYSFFFFFTGGEGDYLRGNKSIPVRQPTPSTGRISTNTSFCLLVLGT